MAYRRYNLRIEFHVGNMSSAASSIRTMTAAQNAGCSQRAQIQRVPPLPDPVGHPLNVAVVANLFFY